MSVPIDPVKLYINQFIQNFDYVDAIFLAERLYAEVKNEESTYLLARTYYLSGDVNKSYWLLRNSSIEHISTAKLLLAKCCFDIEKIHEAEAVLVGSWSSIDQLSLDDFVNEHGEQASFALQLLGKVCEKSDRVLKAGECYRRSLKLNPFLWSSFQALCNLGERVDTSIFCSSALKLPSRTVPDIQPNVCTSPCIESPKDQINENQIIEQTNVNNNIKQTQQQIVKLADNLLNVGTTINVGLITSTPIDRIADSDQDLIDKFTPPTIMTPTWVPSLRNPPLAPKRTNNRVGQQFEYDESSTSTSTTALVATITSHHRREATSATINDTRKTTSTRKAQRRVGATQQTSVLGTYGNVISQTNTQTRTTPTTSITTRTQTPLSSDAIKENTKSVRTLPKRNQRPKSTRVPCSEMGLTTPTSFESPTKMTTRSQVRHSNTNNTSINGEIEITNKKDKLRKIQLTHHRTSEIVENILNVLKLLGEGLQHLSLYECRQAVDIFESITIKHLDTPYVLSNLALSLYHLHDYQKASLIYRQLRTKFPYHIDGLEYYSTVLWQLKDDVALATLAHELTETHRKHPASWCASGNCLSLHHEYDKAIQAFKRAIQIAPESDYAYTLLGNEYAVIDELERALACFRKAIQLNGRSYKAWNGVALVYLRQEKFPNADFHFSKAANIFRTNPDLICHWAIAQHKCHRSESALSLLNEALKIDPKNALCKFHKAGLLLHLERYHEALSELEELRQIAPKESLVYYLLSKVHRHLKNFHYSYMYMSWSMDLDPKGANNQLKENADKLYSKDEDLLLGMEEMASSITEDDMSQMASQSSLQDMQPMDSSEEII